jgi:hypothetical protein
MKVLLKANCFRWQRRALWLGLGCMASALGAYAQPPHEAVDYAQASNWLCRPDNPRACAVDMSTTIVHADGTMRMEPWSDNPLARIDCFYVYPTVSQDSTPNSDLVAGPEEYNVVRSQFARLGSECRTFAPLYRQVTLTALRAGLGGGPGMNPDRELGYNDVLAAWNYYLEHHNDGRGVVLIGHSQGSGVLTRLISNEIDGKPVQDKIISAMLLGTTVQVPAGEKVGGTFKHMPICESAAQTGCIISYSSYRAEIPPQASGMFARNGNGSVAICTNPAQLAKGGTLLHAYLSNSTAEGFSSTGPSPWTSAGSEIHTPFVSVPGLLSGECVNRNGFHYLEVTVLADPLDNRTDQIAGDVLNPDGSVNAGWGLHLIDVNVAMGDLVSLVHQQARSYLQR